MPQKSRRQINDIQDKVMIYLKLQRFQPAEELLRQAMDEHGPLANLLNLMGVCCHRQSKFPEAIEYFEKAKATNPRFIEAALNLAVTLSDLGFYDASQKVYGELQGQLGDGQTLPDLVLGRLANLHNKTAQGYEHAGLYDQATQEYAKALQIYPRMPDIRLRLAKLFLRMNSYHQSREQLMVLLDENPNHPECLNLLGTIAFRMGDWDGAQSFWQKTQNVNPSDRTSRTYLRSSSKPASGATI
jgi:tetratricopeptide (TPR) repeat protein